MQCLENNAISNFKSFLDTRNELVNSFIGKFAVNFFTAINNLSEHEQLKHMYIICVLNLFACFFIFIAANQASMQVPISLGQWLIINR
jgi:hypothetical protein